MSAYKLSPDVVHIILASVSDFATLFAAIRVSKQFNDVFRAHPKSIRRSVLENIAGPAFYAAARLAQYECGLENHSDPPASKMPSEDHFRELAWFPTANTAGMIEKISGDVRTLEDFYSMRHKDRSSSTSKLLPEESLRFQRAMYRYWLHMCLTEQQSFLAESIDEDEDEEEDEDEDAWEERENQKIRDGFKAFLTGLSTDELFELLCVAEYCDETSRWNVNKQQLSWGYPFVLESTDPPHLANAVRCDVEDCGSGVNWDLARQVVKDMLVSRKLSEKDIEKNTSIAILKDIAGATDTCSRCNAARGLDLFGTPNISILRGLLPLTQKTSLLPGLLCRNGHEKAELIKYMCPHPGQRRVSEKDIFHELIDIVEVVDGADDEAQPQHQWSKDGWYCLDCIEELYKQRFMAWWKTKKANNGAPALADCWYGYNCRTMTHKLLHAAKLNHLCAPTRGEDPKPTQQPNAPN